MSLTPGVAVAELLAENYTPLMLGDAMGRVTEALEDGGLLLLGEPVKALIGKSRWLLRTLIISGGYASTHREAEIWPCSEDANGCLGLVQLAYGSANPAWRALYTIQIEVENLDTEIDDYIGERVKLTRYTLATMGVKGEAYGKRPLRPRALRVRVRILRRLKRNPGDGRAPWLVGYDCLDGLVAASTAFTLRLLGIGQGSSRGFGLFKIEPLRKPPQANPLLANLQKLDKPGNVKEALEALREAIGGLKQLVRCSVKEGWRRRASTNRIKAGTIDVNRVRVYDYQSKIGWLERNIWSKLPKNLKGMPPSRLTGVYAALEVIGLVALKLSWKIYNREGRSGGGAYHTWILGLPRRQKVSKPTPCFNSTQEPPTGYILEDLKDEGRIRLEHVSNNIYKVVERDGRSFEEGRRESPFRLIPLDLEGRYIALLPLYPHDMVELVQRLYHVGGLAVTIGRKTYFLDGVRLARVEDIAGKGTGRIQHPCKGKTYVNDEVAGVAYPGRRTHPRSRGIKPLKAPRASNAHDLVRKAYEAAIDFLDSLLSWRKW